MSDRGRPRTYSAAVLGDGRVTPITECLGRRLLREIDPLSSEGRSLLSSGRVMLWHEDGARREAVSIAEALDRQASRARTLGLTYPDLPEWTTHHDEMVRRIGRMKKALTARS